MRQSRPVQLICHGRTHWLKNLATCPDLNYIINAASRYSPWTATSISQGYLTAQGGHRIGIGGEVITRDGAIIGIKNATSLCIRVARDFHGIANGMGQVKDSVLILGPPGSGKTTFLRDMIRQVADRACVAVVDERDELFPAAGDFLQGKQMDVLSLCDKPRGIDMALRTLSASYIAMDEITSEADCTALLMAGWCGVSLLATAHAADVHDLYCRPVYRPLVETGLFQTAVVLRPDKSWRLERMKL